MGLEKKTFCLSNIPGISACNTSFLEFQHVTLMTQSYFFYLREKYKISVVKNTLNFFWSVLRGKGCCRDGSVRRFKDAYLCLVHL